VHKFLLGVVDRLLGFCLQDLEAGRLNLCSVQLHEKLDLLKIMQTKHSKRGMFYEN
jgi:hypothetical protein